MSERPESRNDEEPEEEFLDDGLAKTGPPEPEGSQPYEEWSLDRLKGEAREKGVSDYKNMSKNRLIAQLKKRDRET